MRVFSRSRKRWYSHALRYLVLEEALEPDRRYRDAMALARAVIGGRTYQKALQQFRSVKRRDPLRTAPAEIIPIRTQRRKAA